MALAHSGDVERLYEKVRFSLYDNLPCLIHDKRAWSALRELWDWAAANSEDAVGAYRLWAVFLLFCEGSHFANDAIIRMLARSEDSLKVLAAFGDDYRTYPFDLAYATLLGK